MAYQHLISLLTSYKYFSLFFLAIFEGPIVSFGAGFLIHVGILSLWPSYLILILGDIIPDTFFYFIGYWGGNTKFARKLVSRSSFFNKHFNLTEKLWTEHGRVTMFFSKLVYGMALPFLVSAGMVKMPFKKFIFYAIPVSIFQYGIIMFIGYGLGKLYVVGRYVNLAYFIMAGLAVAVVVAYIAISKYARRKIIFIEKQEIKESNQPQRPMTESNKKISCVIPAYNEEKTIARVLDAVCATLDYIDEVIVIDDASTDKTQNIVRNIMKEFPQVSLLVNDKNIGKSKSISRGILTSRGDLVIFLDADLLGLRSDNIVDLIKPVKDGSADVAISIRGNSPGWMKKINLDFMSGERVLPKSILVSYVKQISKLKNFGLEVFVNRIIIEKKLRIKTVAMNNVTNDMKWLKRGFLSGIKGEILMWCDIFKTVSVYEFMNQNIKMKRLLV